MKAVTRHAAALAAALGSLFAVGCSRGNAAGRVYRIGWEEVPLVQYALPNGEPTGRAIEIVKEAARRRAIRLEWVYRPESSERALRGHAVDLWPLMTITEERRRYVHLTDPYEEHEHVFLVRASSPFTYSRQLALSAVSVDRIPVTRQILERHFPDVRVIVQDTVHDAVAAVCSGKSEAAMAEQHAANAAVLEGAGCAAPGLRIIRDRSLSRQLAIGAVFEAADVADALRAEIAAMSFDGTLARLNAGSSYSAESEMAYLGSMLTERQRLRNYQLGLAGVGLLLAFSIASAVGYRRTRNRERKAGWALREAEAKLRLVADSLDEMVLAYDMRRRLTYANPAVYRVTGFHLDQIPPEGLVSRVHHQDQLVMSAAWEEAFWGKPVTGLEYRLIDRDGDEKWVSASWGPIFDEGGRQAGVRGSLRDVTARKRAEQAAAAAEIKFRTVFEAAPAGAFIADEEGRFLDVNDAACRQLGYTRRELLRRSALDIVPAGQAGHVRAILKTASPEGLAFESRHVRADGTEVPVDVSVHGMQLHGRPAILGFAGDAAGRKRAEEAHAGLQQQLYQAQKLESVGRLAGGIAHDFNNLLTVINGYSQLTLERTGPDDARRQGLQQIRNAGERAAGLTKQLLAFSRKQFIEPRPVDVNHLVRESHTMLDRLLGDDVELTVDLEPGLGLVMADAVQIHQVLMNLAVNARDAMPCGGRLSIRTQAVELDGPEAAPGPYVQLSISDTGVGISDEVRPHLFEPFFTTKQPGVGTGLGLSTVHGIVQQHRGAISVASEPGQGTTFHILLPVTAEPVAAVPEPAAGPVDGTETILVVEDQDAVRRLITEVLAGRGYQVLEAASAAEAVETFQAHKGKIDLVVSDVIMPRMNGRQLMEQVSVIAPRVPFLFVSGYTADVIAGQGVLEFLSKPVHPSALLNKVREVLDRQS